MFSLRSWTWIVGLLLLALLAPRGVALVLLLEAEVRAGLPREPRWMVILGGGSGDRVRYARDFCRRWPRAEVILAGSEPELRFMAEVASELQIQKVRTVLVAPSSTFEAVRVLAGLDPPIVVFTHTWHARRVRYLWIRETYRIAPYVITIDDGPFDEQEIYKLLWTIAFY